MRVRACVRASWYISFSMSLMVAVEVVCCLSRERERERERSREMYRKFLHEEAVEMRPLVAMRPWINVMVMTHGR